MTSSLTNQISGESNSETFASLWTALQNSYEGTNITRTVSRLLHMYQPEDGILAYERLLRTLYVLLEDFDTNGFRLLVSMVPPPKDIPDSTIQDIFQKATGFARMTSAIQSHFANSEKGVGSNRPIINSENSETFNGSPQTVSPDPVEFRGFPSNEICKTQIRVQNINQFYEPTCVKYTPQAYHTCNHYESHQISGKIQDQQIPNSASTPIDYRMKWVYTPYLLRKNAICQSTQFYQDPLVIFQTADQKHLGIPISQINHLQRGDHSRPTKECLRNLKQPVFIDLSNDQEENMDLRLIDSKNAQIHENNNFSEEMKKSLSLETKIEEDIELHQEETNLFRKEIKLRQRAIQEDIFKMDVVQENFIESNSAVTSQAKDLEPEDLEVHNVLRQSVHKFLEKVKGEQSVSTQVIPNVTLKVLNSKTKKTVSDETSAFIDCWKKIITRSVLGRDPKSTSADSEKKTGIFIENDAEVRKDTDKKSRKKKTNPPLRPKSERVAQRTPNRILLGEMENQSSSSKNSTKSINNYNSNKELTLAESNLRFQNKSCELNSINMLQQANSISELATYKKQYYDALLSIQKAKVAVANSLAISSVGNTTGYDPYYFNYLHRQHQLTQNQQRFLVKTQFSTQRPLQPVVSNNQNAPNFLSNCNDWRYPSFGQIRFPRHSHAVYPSPMNPSTFSSFLSQDNATREIRQCSENQYDQLRPKIKRKKMEEIVGTLREPENVSMQQNSSSQ